jgi:dihydroorotase
MVGSSLLCSVVEGWHDLLHAMTSEGSHYDLLVKGGKAVDPAQGLSAERDVAILGSKVVRVAANIPEGEARQVLNARGKIVTPGLIDIHVHVYEGVTTYGIPTDPNCIAKGVTTVVDAGSAGANTFPGFRKYVINVADTRVFALLNISVIGLTADSEDSPYGELIDLRYADPKVAIRTIEKNRDVILGLKIRLDRDITGDHDIAALRLAREASDAVKLPLMVHIGDSYTPLKDILPMLNKGDVVTHCFRGEPGGILYTDGRIMPAVRSAVERGVHLDVGHGEGSFSFATAEKAMKQDVLPGTISSDLHHFDVDGPVFDLATTLSKFLHLGLTLEQVIERAATNPANVFGFPSGLGTLREGAEADVAVWTLSEGDFEFVDSLDVKPVASRSESMQWLQTWRAQQAGRPERLREMCR